MNAESYPERKNANIGGSHFPLASLWQEGQKKLIDWWKYFCFFCLGSFLETRGDWWVEIAEISFIMKVISEMST